MATSTLDGIVEEAALKRSFSNMRVFEHITFRRPDGSSVRLGKTIMSGTVADQLHPGVSGRFYLYSTIDHKGLHGFRDTQGRAAYGFPRNNEYGAIACAVIGALLIWFHLSVNDALSIWGVICVVIGVPSFFIYLSARLAAQKQFEADAQYRPPAAAPAAA